MRHPEWSDLQTAGFALSDMGARRGLGEHPRTQGGPTWRILAMVISIACGFSHSASGAASAPLLPTDSLSVRGCAEWARTGSLETQAARWTALAAELDADATRHNAEPRLALHSGVLVAPPGFYDPAITNLGEYDLRLIMAMGLLDGGQLHRDRDRAVAASHGAAADLTAISTATALEAARLASAIVQTRERIGRHRSEKLATTQVLDAVRSGARVGARSQSDVLRLQLDVQTLSMELDDLESELAVLGRGLGTLLAPDSLGVSFLAVRDTSWNEQPPSPSDSLVVLERFAAGADVLHAQAAVEMARLDVASARGSGAGKLGLALDAGFAGTNLTDLSPIEAGTASAHSGLVDRLQRDLGASLRLDYLLPLRSPGMRSSVAARDADAGAARTRITQARAVARTAALDLVARWRDSARRLADADSTASLAESNLLRMRSLYLAGSSTLLDLSDSRRARLEAADRQDALRREVHLMVVESEIPR